MSLGPGEADLMTPEARRALELAEVVVGYSGYVDLVNPEFLQGKEVLSTGMRGEVERAGLAVDRAASGRNVAVVCSGDAGVYAMAGLLLEVMEARGLVQEGPEGLDFAVVPGVSALNAAAALLGAPLMHDFASISLSDLLTPWETIEKRLDAAASADFVICLYNPRSTRRADHLGRALEIVGRHRSPETPVGAVKRAYRTGQEVRVFRLDAVDQDFVDMRTTLIVGNSATRTAGRFLLTPRGYHQRYDVS